MLLSLRGYELSVKLDPVQGLEKKLQEAKLKNLGQGKSGNARSQAAIPVVEEEDEAGPQLPSAEMIR